MRVSIAGTGYVGLVSGVCLAEKGHQVACVDVDGPKVDRLNRGEPPIHERGLGELLRRNLRTRFRATTDLKRAVHDSDLTLIAVGTPLQTDPERPNGGRIDLSQVRKVSQEIGSALAEKPGYHLVAVKSTVVPGTTDTVVSPILQDASGKKAGRDFGVGTNPEFLSEGQAVDDFMHPDRIVLGGDGPREWSLLDDLYQCFDGVPRIRTTNRTAEMIKYTSNSLLAAMISFSNEIADLCSVLEGVDVADVMRGVHASWYLSPPAAGGGRRPAPIADFLAAGCGFGGSCLPKDVEALVRHGQQAGCPMPLLNAVLEINRARPRQMVALLGKHFASLEGVRVAVLGLAFKPGTDDVRCSPALAVVRDLLARGAAVRAYDPVANSRAREALADPRVRFCDVLEEALVGAEAVLLATRWDEFQRVPELLAGRKPPPVCVDGRRMLDPGAVERYEGIGRSVPCCPAKAGGAAVPESR